MLSRINSFFHSVCFFIFFTHIKVLFFTYWAAPLAWIIVHVPDYKAQFEPLETAAISCILEGKPLLCGVSLLSFCTSQSVSMYVHMCVCHKDAGPLDCTCTNFFLWLTLDRNSVMETHRQDQRGNISTVLCFYSGETLGADIFVS